MCEAQQTGDMPGKSAQAELIKVLGRLVLVNAQDIADLTEVLNHTYLLAEDSPLAKLYVVAGKNNR